LQPGVLLSTWPVFTEAMYLLGSHVGYSAQESLWKWLAGRRLKLWDAAPADVDRMSDLMKTYRDVPMDLADASLVAAAEATGIRDVFTFDGHFRIYRLRDGSFLNVIP
jgi:uncharacterized protein